MSQQPSRSRPVALIAGASRGIGAETALAFAVNGHDVVLGARDGAALEHVVERIERAGSRAIAVPTDVGDDGSMQALVASAIERFGRLDAAFNNATDGHPDRSSPITSSALVLTHNDSPLRRCRCADSGSRRRWPMSCC